MDKFLELADSQENESNLGHTQGGGSLTLPAAEKGTNPMRRSVDSTGSGGSGKAGRVGHTHSHGAGAKNKSAGNHRNSGGKPGSNLGQDGKIRRSGGGSGGGVGGYSNRRYFSILHIRSLTNLPTH